MGKWFEVTKKLVIPTLAAALALVGYSYAANVNTAAASSNSAAANVQAAEKTVGSIFLGQQDNDQGKDNEVNEANEAQEDKDLAGKAKISNQDAEKAALASVPGAKVLESELGNEDGYLVYDVSLDNGGTTIEIKVDAGNGKVLSTQNDAEEEDQEGSAEENEAQGPDDDNLEVEVEE